MGMFYYTFPSDPYAQTYYNARFEPHPDVDLEVLLSLADAYRQAAGSAAPSAA